MKKRRNRNDGPTAEAMRQIAAGVEATTGEALVNLCTAQMVRRALVLILRRQILGEDS